jgi:hypothetical protein
LYNEYGSKLLLDTLYSHDFCASYDEVRRYITSLANCEIDRFGNKVHVPNGIRSVAEGRYLVQQGSDNIDINTETVDDKETFHLIARAVFQLQRQSDTPSNNNQIQVARSPLISLPVNETTTSIMSRLKSPPLDLNPLVLITRMNKSSHVPSVILMCVILHGYF